MHKELANTSPDGSIPAVVVENISHRFAAGDGMFTALRDVSFTVKPGEFIALLGPSGCGKTTLLNFVAGLLVPDQGRVLVNGEPVRSPRPDVGYMLARDALLPWRTARKNVELLLEARRGSREARRRRATDLLAELDLLAFADSYRYQLSQGMRQRVSLARTLAPDPDVLLMDEPFASLDAQTRQVIQEWFLGIWEKTAKTVLFVTHDLEEAILLADRIVMFSSRPGRIVDVRKVPLPRPRGALDEWRFSELFRTSHRELWYEFRDNAMQTRPT